MEIDKFDNIRPYNNSEIGAAMTRIASNPLFKDIAAHLFPGQGESTFANILLGCHNVDDFQNRVMAFVINKILKDTAKKLTFGGLDYFLPDSRYLMISNHRDIVLDSAIIQLILHENKKPTSEIAVGDNLISSDFIEDIARSNKMIKVVRSSSPREVYNTSKILSEYIRYNITNKYSSIWIAERNGRTKDGVDATEQGLLKMLEMSGTGDFINDFDDLNIMPVSISYEFEPCDLLKAIEIFVSKTRKYVKSKNEDLNSILTGIMQFKGNIHIEFNEPITHEEIKQSVSIDTNDKNEKFKALGLIMDKKINANFHLWKNNYIAYDILNKSSKYSDKYSDVDKSNFENYLNYKLSSSDIEQNQYGDIREIFLGIYSNPVKSKEILSRP